MFQHRAMRCRGRPRPTEYVKPGDLIGFSGHSWQSAGINLATYGIPFWNISHVAILGEVGGRLLLFESTTMAGAPCVIQGKEVSGTQAHWITPRVEAYRGKVWHYPLYRPLYRVEAARLTGFLLTYVGRDYDAIGAFRCGGIGWSWLESRLHPADLSSLFCSEYCAAAHARVGILQTDHVSRWNPNRLLRVERRRGILLRPSRLK